MNNQNNIDIACKRILHAKKNKIKTLDLSYLKLLEIPIDISDMYYLNELNLSNNNLSRFPSVIRKLDNLFRLDLSYNNLCEISFDIERKYLFRFLDLSFNAFNVIPEDIDLLDANCNIIFDGNPFLEELPTELESRDINFIRFYFDSLKRSQHNEKLFETKLIIVGKGDVGKTTLMQVLKDTNFIVKIGNEGPTHGIDINSLLYEILFPAKRPYYNVFVDFEKLYLRVESEEMEENEEENEEEEEDQSFLNNPNSTDFIHISETEELYSWEIEDDYYTESIRFQEEPYYTHDAWISKNVKINGWDFGGQEIFYSTHLFFLTKRSIYILVWDSRTDDTDENFEYWFNIIKRLSNSSPVIVVMNKMDINYKKVDELYYKNRFANIVKFIEISCVTKQGILELKECIKEEIRKLPHMGDKLPALWNEVREKIKTTKEDFISFGLFQSYFGLSLNEEQIGYISDYLHDLGDIIHFRSEFGLQNIVIIKPHWLTKAIYELIKSIEIQRNNGFFNVSDLRKILNISKYPLEQHHHILKLMEKFEICFKTIGSNDDYIIPTLLNPSPKFNIDNFNKNQEQVSIRIEYKYKFTPFGIIERLICRLNSYVMDGNYWKSGLLVTFEDSKALIRVLKTDKTIRVEVVDGIKSNLYSIIRSELLAINKSINLKEGDFTENLACNCSVCVVSESPKMYPRLALQRFMSKNILTISCLESAETIKIEELLLGYRSSFHDSSLIKYFINACSELQGYHKILSSHNENEKNVILQKILSTHLKKFEYIVKEQTTWGKSSSAKSTGIIDIFVQSQEGSPITFFEGIDLEYLDTTKIKDHVNKVINSYDANGLKEKYFGVYYKANHFFDFCKRYLEYNNEVLIAGIERGSFEDVSKTYIQASEIRVFRTIYYRNEIRLTLYHILINLNL